MRRVIKYVAFYDVPNGETKRICSLAARGKIDYICSAIARAGFGVNIISPSWIDRESDTCFKGAEHLSITEQKKVTFFPSFQSKNRITGAIRIAASLLCVFLYLLFNTKRGEKILVYHALWLSFPIRLAKLFKSLRIILEVEEVYSDVWKNSTTRAFRNAEHRLIESADYYILVSDLLKERLARPNAEVLYGSYAPIKERAVNRRKEVHLVYAGEIDSTKCGAINSVRMMRHLPSNYILHVIGTGKPAEIHFLQELINQENQHCNRPACAYDGVLHGDDYSAYLQNCDLAVNPQNTGAYMNTGFPSKILSYLTHDLRVVSSRLPCIERSPLAEYIHFARSESPEHIAEAVVSVDLSEPNHCLERIRDLDRRFVRKLKTMLA
jgi:hypothetical protein